MLPAAARPGARALVLLLAAPAAAAASARPATPIANAAVMIDMVQNNPGDPVGWEQTKYFDPKELKKLNYTGMTTTRRDERHAGDRLPHSRP